MQRRAVVIVGAGPAGTATALRLAQLAPAIAADTVVLDKARHPRDKTCAGGVIPKVRRLLDDLDVPFTVPRARVDAARVGVPGRTIVVPGRALCDVVRRREFDAHLVAAVRERGIEVREETRVTGLVREGDGVRVETSAGALRARVVIGADGSGSVVRRALVPGGAGPIARAVMCDVPVEATGWDGHEAHRYDFDFTACPRGLHGYRWAFPCLIDGAPHVNVGVYALPPVDGPRLQAELAAELARIGMTTPAPSWKAFPIRTWAFGTPVAAPRALLVGDAAGCDPLMGEGISYAIEYGMLAAAAIVRAGPHGEPSADHARSVTRGGVGRKLGRLAFAARRFYGRHAALWFRVAAASRRAQSIGLQWYNGVDGFDERGTLALLWILARGPRFDHPPRVC